MQQLSGMPIVDFAYELNWDLSTSNLPSGNYEVLRNDGGLLYFGQQPHQINLWIVPKMNIVYHIKNINCLGSTDSMRYKIRYPYTTSNTWYGWIPNPNLTAGYYFGCIDSIPFNTQQSQDSVYLEIEVTRSGNSSVIRDSMLLDPTKIQDTIKIYY